MGQTLTLTLAEPAEIGEVGLVPGYAKTDPRSGADRYAENNRITRVRWTFSDGSSVVQELDGSATNRSLQSIRIPPVDSDTVSVEVLASTRAPETPSRSARCGSAARPADRTEPVIARVVAMKVLVTGGAGYIGSTTAKALEEAGHVPVILDSLLTGPRAFVRDRIFYEGDIGDRSLLRRIADEHPDIACTIHMAARIIVPESVEKPYEYYRDNVTKSLELFDELTSWAWVTSCSPRPPRSTAPCPASASTSPPRSTPRRPTREPSA